MLFTYKLTPPTLNDGEVTGGLADAAGRIVVAASGSVASGATDSGNPIKIGGRFNTTMPTLTDGQRGDAQFTSRGALIAELYSGGGALANANGLAVQPALSSTFWSYAGASGGITNTSDVAVKAAAGASVRNYISGIQFKNTAAVASEIVIKDGSTVLWRGHVSASMSVSDGYTFNPPLRGTANTAVNVAMLTTSTATIVNVQGYTGA